MNAIPHDGPRDDHRRGGKAQLDPGIDTKDTLHGRIAHKHEARKRYSGPMLSNALPTTSSASHGDVTDEQLLADYRHGDKAAFQKLVERYQREMFHFLVRFLGDRAAAEDIFQETFLQVHQSADQFDPERRFRPWLFT